MSIRTLVYAYILGGLTFLPLVIISIVFFAVYTSVPVGDPDVTKPAKASLQDQSVSEEPEVASATRDIDDQPKARKGWLIMRRTFEETEQNASYATKVRGFLDARSKDPKRSRPKDMWYVALKGKVLYLYEDEAMQECEAAIEMGGHDVMIYPEGLQDGELFAKRTAIMLRPRIPPPDKEMPSLTKEMKLGEGLVDEKKQEAEERDTGLSKKKEKKRAEELEKLAEIQKARDAARDEAHTVLTPWFIFVRSNVEMEDWYHALVHASDHSANHPTLEPLEPVFKVPDMEHLVSTLDEQPDVIPTRWLNALIGRLFFSFYRTQLLERFIIGRLMKKLAKVKRPAFLSDVNIKEVSVGNRPPTFSKPMLKELTKEGDASLEVRIHYKGEVRVTAEATAIINLGPRFKTYTVKLVLAAVLREIEGNLLIKVKRPPSNRIWYAFTQMPRMELDVEPVVSDRQITWGMILSTIESRLKEIILESIVLPNMDDIAFFESSSYEHRGGIWADASRETHEPSESLNASDAGPSASTTALPGSTASQDAAAVPQSAEPTSTGERSMSAPLPLHPISEPASLSADVSVLGNSSNPSATKRRSWFAALRNEDSIASDPSISTESAISSEAARGRSVVSGFSAPEVAQPTSSTAEGGETVPEPPVRTTSSDVSLLRPGTSQRSTSQHSSSSTSSSRSGTPEREESARRPPTPSSPQVFANGTVPSSPGNGSSFLSTLKSRDKQAIQAQAKEAMRKWGVNWASLRRNNEGSEDVPDGGPTEQRPTNSQASLSQKIRPSFAEIRAKVEERRSSRHDLDGTAPIAIPQRGDERQRVVSQPSVPNPGRPSSFTGGLSTSPAGPSRVRTTSELDGSLQTSKYVAPSMSRTTTQLHTPSQPDFPSVSPPPTPAPIHTQPPQAKTMTIPGIHASHRGEVQSLGYVAPAPSTDQKGKSPALQTVVTRLFKPQGQGQTEHDFSSSAPEPQPSHREVVETEAAQSPQGPPPLPPRSVSSASAALKSIQSRVESGRLSTDEQSRGSTPEPVGDPTGSNDGASVHDMPKAAPPPLPPRKVPVQ
ncbi:hypothetical protein PUNSTDRAFT_110484 [Punctularia strigosozonata HHB-11173 SS5]|uniref:uncharacterized protein n=1 Tax=Punctularia strigosozonata (strain HHB-11173) TaxID=741275 RepID=UPI000441825A|nr:uncharacterized protein PUNSTDRAFT_110484 [Punctularia strigosozonata HHB-11173 SS5]EIN14385.1 hypothetical protein PUNSTDRAFT_110484 [Punctularia strigosozonata HHB-11173 SS5]